MPTRPITLIVIFLVSTFPFWRLSAAAQLFEPPPVSSNAWANLTAPRNDVQLLLPPVLPPAAFVRVISSDLHQLCTHLASLEGASLPDRTASVEGEVCSWLKPVVDRVGDVTGRSIFFMAASHNGSVKSIRYKLNSTVETLELDLVQLTGSAARLHQVRQWAMPSSLAEAISIGSPLELEYGGIEYKWSREFGEIPRFNLQMTFGERNALWLQRSDRFQPRDP